jgi:hypothetical protein
MPVRVKKTRQNKRLEPRSDSIGTEKAPGFDPKVARRRFPDAELTPSHVKPPQEVLAEFEGILEMMQPENGTLK